MTAKAEYNPNPTDNWVKDTLAEDQADYLRSVGLMPDSRAVEAQVQSELVRLDAQQRHQRAGKQRALRPRARKALDNFRGRVDQAVKIRRRQRNRCQCGGICRNCKLETRLRLLVQTGNGSTFAAPDFLFPMHARAIADEFVAMRHNRGRYRDAKPVDQERMLRRALEDIADRSTGALGGWK